jgi:hypothetical protein
MVVDEESWVVSWWGDDRFSIRKQNLQASRGDYYRWRVRVFCVRVFVIV